MGNTDIKSNGRRRKVEPVEIVDNMKFLKKEVKHYREYNERMIRT
jgi:hypothetical protein